MRWGVDGNSIPVMIDLHKIARKRFPVKADNYMKLYIANTICRDGLPPDPDDDPPPPTVVLSIVQSRSEGGYLSESFSRRNQSEMID